jgi:hypothetical protein
MACCYPWTIPLARVIAVAAGMKFEVGVAAGSVSFPVGGKLACWGLGSLLERWPSSLRRLAWR